MSQPSALTAARQHAQALAGSGDLAGARAVLERAAEMGRAGLGEDDPDVLATAHQLAGVHQQADDPAAARRVLEEAYAAGQWRLGDADPLMLAISFDLGVVAAELGNRHEARRAFSRVAEHGPAVLGAEHWTVAQARAFLGEESPTAQPAGADGMPAAPRDTAGGDALSEPTVIVPTVGSRPAPSAPTDTGLPPAGQHRPVAYPDAPPAARPAFGPAPTPAPTPARPGPGPAPSSAPPLTPPPPGPVPTGAAVPATGGSTYGRRGPALFAAIAAVLAAVIAVVALVVVLARGNDRPRQPDQPSLEGAPPTDVRLRDSGTSIEVSWTDPASGMTSFVVSVGHPGEVLKPMGHPGPGETSFDLKGLNPELDYCVAVVAVYSTTKFASSPPTCTSRSGGGAQPSATQ
ncbi:fibronectin type III domain-containing protein [Krasilnikovia cinnamomea]|uniref:fibronectin type III domain-containing protein n=1 Tax=Krasilnikovia cinnamomea TaxID=349313 RepID=UPI0013EF4785|nr:tetratricopeptide repeat protein [Krasilnikovia cinnamomea]